MTAKYTDPGAMDIDSVQKPVTHYEVIILGAGAAGLLCAMTAASRGRRVLVLEKANKVGKKILMSGGGRCNFTNLDVQARNYISANPHFCKAALKRYTQWDFIALTQRHEIATEERKHGQLFCRGSAREILAMLLAECAQAGVEILTHCDIKRVKTVAADALRAAHGGRYLLGFVQGQQGPERSMCCQSLVIATGALSVPTLGGSGMGYEIARQFGLSVTARQAGLVPFMFSDKLKLLCERLSGLSVPVEVTCKSRSFSENLLFTHRGMSGPVVLQISSYWHAGDEISINLLPELDAGAWLLQGKQSKAKSNLKNLLQQVLPKALVNELEGLWWSEAAQIPLAQYADKKLLSIGDQLNQWRLKPAATEGYRTAEVTCGGVDTTAISSKTMEVIQHPGLYFIGEVLDVTGHLGGFNFQWAWSSGYSAGMVA